MPPPKAQPHNTQASIPITEYDDRRSLERKLLPATIYHYLKTKKRFDWFTSARMTRMMHHLRPHLFCNPEGGNPFGDMMANEVGCCKRWEICQFTRPPPHEQPPLAKTMEWFRFLDQNKHFAY